MDNNPQTRSYAYNKEYAKKWDSKFDKVLLRIPSGQKGIWQAEASRVGESVNQYIIRAVEERMNREHR